MSNKPLKIGDTYNLLTIISTEGIINSRTHYKCLCECGNITLVEGSKIKNGHTKSCGCIRKFVDYGKARGEYGVSIRNSIISSYKLNAKNRNLEFSIKNDLMIQLFQSNCFYCGSPPIKTRTKNKLYGHYTYNGIDRLNNDLGYIEENVVSCCQICNFKKSSQNYEDFIKWIDKTYKNLKKEKRI